MGSTTFLTALANPIENASSYKNSPHRNWKLGLRTLTLCLIMGPIAISARWIKQYLRYSVSGASTSGPYDVSSDSFKGGIFFECMMLAAVSLRITLCKSCFTRCILIYGFALVRYIGTVEYCRNSHILPQQTRHPPRRTYRNGFSVMDVSSRSTSIRSYTIQRRSTCWLLRWCVGVLSNQSIVLWVLAIATTGIGYTRCDMHVCRPNRYEATKGVPIRVQNS